MSTGLRLVKATTITPAMLIGTDVPETDYAAWAVGTAYGEGDRVIVLAEHRVYQSIQAANTGHVPATNPLWWVEVGLTNRWKAFDLSSTTKTLKNGGCYYEIKPGIATNAVCLLNISGILSVRIRLTDPTFGVVYDETTDLSFVPTDTGWWEWFFGERRQPKQFLALDLPNYPNATVRIDLAGDVSIGVLMLGRIATLGIGVSIGARVGIKDYSRKEVNEWGDTVLVQRAYAKGGSFSVLIDNTQLDAVQEALADVRATPCLWIFSQRFLATIVFGYYQDFEINIAYTYNSECTLNIEGLT